MASYKVLFHREAEKELRKIPKAEVQRLVELIEKLSLDPYPSHAKKLTGSEYYRVRSGNYRIVYGIQKTELQIMIIKIGHRKDVYRP